jgi:DNA-damage-inducible protein J
MATPQSTIQIRIDAKTKQQSKKLFASFGLDMSSAVKLFLNTAIKTNSIPLQLRTVNGYTPEYEQMLIAETAEALKSGKRYTDLDELFTDLDLK